MTCTVSKGVKGRSVYYTDRITAHEDTSFEAEVMMSAAGKGKAIPLQAWTGPEGSRRLRLPDFKTIGT
jgi:hypothetical protein